MNSLSLVNDFKTSIIDLKKPQVFIYQHLINQLQTFLCKLLKKNPILCLSNICSVNFILFLVPCSCFDQPYLKSKIILSISFVWRLSGSFNTVIRWEAFWFSLVKNDPSILKNKNGFIHFKLETISKNA